MVVESRVSTNSGVSSVQRGRFDHLSGRKRQIDDEMENIAETLSSESFSNIGLKKPLIDAQGFPLAGIDIHRVRELRNRFAILETDLKSVVAEIESLLHEIHEHARNTGSVSSGDRRPMLPFGRVETVVPSSAAEDAGLLVGDKVIKFAHLCCYRKEDANVCYDAIPSVLAGLQPNEPLPITVKRLGRESELLTFDVHPREGRIGCLIKPL